MIVISEHWDVGRVDHGVGEEAAVIVLVFPVVVIHRTVLERQVEGARPAEVFLLGTSSAEKAAARMGGRCEVEGHDVVSFRLMTAMGGESGLVGHFESRLVRTSISWHVIVFGRVVTCLLYCCGDLLGDVDLAGWPDVSAGFRDSDGFLAEAYGEVTGDAGFEWAHG